MLNNNSHSYTIDIESIYHLCDISWKYGTPINTQITIYQGANCYSFVYCIETVSEVEKMIETAKFNRKFQEHLDE